VPDTESRTRVTLSSRRVHWQRSIEARSRAQQPELHAHPLHMAPRATRCGTRADRRFATLPRLSGVAAYAVRGKTRPSAQRRPFLHPSTCGGDEQLWHSDDAPKSPDRLGVDEAQTATRTNDAELPFANSRLRSAPPLSTSCWAARAAVVASCMLATENSVSSDVCCAERGLVGWRLRQSRQGRRWWWRCRWSSPSVDTTR